MPQRHHLPGNPREDDEIRRLWQEVRGQQIAASSTIKGGVISEAGEHTDVLIPNCPPPIVGSTTEHTIRIEPPAAPAVAQVPPPDHRNPEWVWHYGTQAVLPIIDLPVDHSVLDLHVYVASGLQAGDLGFVQIAVGEPWDQDAPVIWSPDYTYGPHNNPPWTAFSLMAKTTLPHRKDKYELGHPVAPAQPPNSVNYNWHYRKYMTPGVYHYPTQNRRLAVFARSAYPLARGVVIYVFIRVARFDFYGLQES